MLKTAPYANFVVNFMEWYSIAGLGTNAVLQANSGGAGDFKIGNYEASEGIFLNPSKTGLTDTASPQYLPNYASQWVVNNKAGESLRPPGSIGDAIYFTGGTEMFSDVTTLTVDSTVPI